MTAVRLNRLGSQEYLLSSGAVILGIVMFLDWFSASAGAGEFRRQGGSLEFTVDDGRRTAWEAFTTTDLVLAASVVAAVACVVLTTRGGRNEAVRMLAGVETALAVLSIFIVAIRIATPPSLGLAPNVDVTATASAWIGLLACCLLAAGGALALRRAGERRSGPAVG